jgi:hypothetical protein
MKTLLAAAALSAALAVPAAAAPPTALERLRDDALENDKEAWDIVEDLTTEIGPRLAGTEAEARARQWAVKRLKALGFHNVHIEDTTMATWVRGAETAEIVSPFPQRLVVTALGGNRAREDDTIDHAVGLADVAAVGAEVGPDRPLALVHARGDGSAEEAATALLKAVHVGDEAPAARPVLLGRV